MATACATRSTRAWAASPSSEARGSWADYIASLRSARELAADIRRKRFGCLELLDLYFARVEKHNPPLNAIIAMDVEGARKRARAADRALARKQLWGPLHGVPMTLRIARTHAVPSAPSPRHAGKRHAVSPAGPSLTPGMVRVTGAKASVGTALAC